MSKQWNAVASIGLLAFVCIGFEMCVSEAPKRDPNGCDVCAPAVAMGGCAPKPLVLQPWGVAGVRDAGNE